MIAEKVAVIQELGEAPNLKTDATFAVVQDIGKQYTTFQTRLGKRDGCLMFGEKMVTDSRHTDFISKHA